MNFCLSPFLEVFTTQQLSSWSVFSEFVIWLLPSWLSCCRHFSFVFGSGCKIQRLFTGNLVHHYVYWYKVWCKSCFWLWIIISRIENIELFIVTQSIHCKTKIAYIWNTNIYFVDITTHIDKNANIHHWGFSCKGDILTHAESLKTKDY